jgi:hypothetical protein
MTFFKKNSLYIFAIVAALFALPVSPAQANTCAISGDTVVDQAYVTAGGCTAIEIQGNVSTTWNGTVDLGGGTVTVKSGYTMTLGQASEILLGASDDFVIESGATASHYGEDVAGFRLTARNVTVSGTLSATGKGCRRGDPSGGSGYGADAATGVCALNTGGYGVGGGGGGVGGGGGSNGGIGGGGGPSAAGGSTLYDGSFAPRFLGSGGGTGYYSTAFGGAGGGLIHVTSTGTLTVSGSIVANGDGGIYDGIYNGGGGGAGGSILIRAATLAGAGTISVSGGAGGAGGGGGGGGKVAVYYGALTSFSLTNITAAGGAGGAGGLWGTGVSGGGGTTYILDRFTDDGGGAITITSGFDFPTTGDYTRQDITISSGAILRCRTAASGLTISTAAALELDSVTWTCSTTIDQLQIHSDTGLYTTSSSITFSGTTNLLISAPEWHNVTTTLSFAKAGSVAEFDIDSDLVFRGFVYTGGNQGETSADGGSCSFQTLTA